MHTLFANSVTEWVKAATGVVQTFFANFDPLGSIILALIVFIVLKKVCGLLKKLIEKALDKTNLDEKLAAKVGYKSDVSKMISTIAYLIMMIYAAVIALTIGKQGEASKPLSNMLEDMLGYIPHIIGAGILLYILLFIAGIVKQLLGTVLAEAKIDQRVGSTTGTPIANALTSAAYGFLILLFIPAVLDVLNIEAVSKPIKGIVNSITGAVPNVLLAGIIIAIGVVIGQIASRVVTNLLKGTGLDQTPSKLGLSIPTEGKNALSNIIGKVVLVSIIVTVLSAAINELKIEIFSGLATGLVSGYFNILVAVIILVAGFIGGKFAFSALSDKNLLVAKIARGLIIAVTAVVALERADIASDITSLPYQVAIYSAGVAVGIGGAIAIGLGARNYVENFLSKRG